ncbi:glycosyltransferase family 4 protein [Gallintestinimicrobium propionicum]|uniref:glycosyltransferase family 4 protein n=1 Tax=Gallintestinimicrobium propionicum TaxID=2981770 RepID=UPI00280BD697|nr:glycosyltransferase family 4 protein [Gallintestinimicrobium propionicum]
MVVYELSTRLAARGHEVTVYNRGRQKGHNAYLEQGVRVKRVFTFKKQILNAMVYSFLATFDTIFHDFDVIHYHAIGPSVPLFLAKLFGKHTVCTVHGLNWRSDKWGGFASFYLRLGEKVAARFADEVIVLSEEEKEYFMKKYKRDSILIHNAVERIAPVPCNVIREKYGLEKDSYILYVGRISPEKGPQDLLEAYQKLRLQERLVLAGPIPETEFGKEMIRKIDADPRVIRTGLVQGQELAELFSNCRLFVLPSHTEGLSLALLEAMSCGGRCLVSDIPANTVITGQYGAEFEAENRDSLAAALSKELTTPKDEVLLKQEMEYVKENFDYDAVIEWHEDVYKCALNRKNEKRWEQNC